MPRTRKGKCLWRARRQQDLQLLTGASAIEMQISAALEKVFLWGRRQGQESLCCVFKHSKLYGRCSCHSSFTSQSGSPRDLTSQVLPDPSGSPLQAWLGSEAESCNFLCCVACSVLRFLMQRAEQRVWATKKNTTR